MILFFDLETTGTNVAKDRIVQMVFSLHPFAGELGSFQGLSCYVNPEVPIPAEASAVHGIHDDDVADEGTFMDRAFDVLDLLKEAKYICGYNIQNFDIPLLAEELARCGLDWPEHLVVVDLYRSWIKRETRTLADAVNRFCGVPIDSRKQHDADYDVFAARNVFEAMIREYNCLSEDLAKDSDNGPACDPARYFKYNEDNVVVFSFGKHKDLPAESQRGYLRWMLNADFPMTTKKFIAQKLGVQ